MVSNGLTDVDILVMILTIIKIEWGTPCSILILLPQVYNYYSISWPIVTVSPDIVLSGKSC